MFDTEHLVEPALLEEDHELGFRLTVAAYGEIVPDGQHFLPDDLEEIVPGRYLAAILSSIDRTKLSGHDVVRLLQARDRLVSHTQAGFYADVGEVAHAYDPDTPEGGPDRSDADPAFRRSRPGSCVAATEPSAGRV